MLQTQSEAELQQPARQQLMNEPLLTILVKLMDSYEQTSDAYE